MGGKGNACRVVERNIGSELAEMGREREKGSGEGRYSGQGGRSAGRGERKARREKARKRPHLVRDAARS